MKTSILFDTHGAGQLTMQADQARMVIDPLIEFLVDCGLPLQFAKHVRHTQCIAIDGEHDWVVFEVPQKFHREASAFIMGAKSAAFDTYERQYAREAEVLAKLCAMQKRTVDEAHELAQNPPPGDGVATERVRYWTLRHPRAFTMILAEAGVRTA
jgi:hypothetical protein